VVLALHFMCFVWISEQTANFALYTINRLISIREMESLTARYALSPYIKYTFCL